MIQHQNRLNAFRTLLEPAGMSGAVLSHPQHFFYFTGILPESGPHLLVVTPQHCIAVSPIPIPELETVTYSNYDIQKGWNLSENAAIALNEALRSCALDGKSVGIETAHLTTRSAITLIDRHMILHDLGNILWSLCKIKDAVEIARIEANVAANDRMFKILQTAIQPGASEFDLWGLVYTEMCRSTGKPIILEADLGVGPRGQTPAAKPGPFQVQAGDAVFLDVYSCQHGYYADTTRVFFTAEPTSKQQEIYTILIEALSAGEKQLHPGVRACDIDAAVRGVIQKGGYGANFPHHSGHAYGLFQQEKPYLIPAETTPIEAGMIMTLEPGIYIPGWGGMRLERNYLINQSGNRTLDHFPIHPFG